MDDQLEFIFTTLVPWAKITNDFQTRFGPVNLALYYESSFLNGQNVHLALMAIRSKQALEIGPTKFVARMYMKRAMFRKMVALLLLRPLQCAESIPEIDNVS